MVVLYRRVVKYGFCMLQETFRDISIYCINTLAEQIVGKLYSNKGFKDCRSPSLKNFFGAGVWIPFLRIFHFRGCETLHLSCCSWRLQLSPQYCHFSMWFRGMVTTEWVMSSILYFVVLIFLIYPGFPFLI